MAIESTSRPLIRAWAPALLWLAVIALESTTVASSANTSRILRPLILFLDPHITAAQFQFVHDLLRKLGHCFGYAMLSLLMLRAWWATLMLPRGAIRVPPWSAMVKAWSLRAAGAAFLATVAVAGLDEWHQTFLSGRTGSAHDVALDSMAAACVQLLVIAFSSVKSKHAAAGN